MIDRNKLKKENKFMSTRYYVYSKNASNNSLSAPKSLKNSETREAARSYKRNATNPQNFGIWDRYNNEPVR